MEFIYETKDDFFMYDEITNEEQIRFPINSSKQNMKNKNCDYRILAIMTLYSNMTPKEISYEKGEEELYRYIYENKIVKFTEEIEELSKIKIHTFLKKVMKLVNLESRPVSAVNTENNGICYYINYTNIKGREYVTIEENILKKLIEIGDSSLIKVYILLRYMCKDEFKKITNKYIVEQIGLSTKSRNNIQKVIEITKLLEENELIIKEKEQVVEAVKNKNKIIKQYKEINKYKIKQ